MREQTSRAFGAALSMAALWLTVIGCSEASAKDSHTDSAKHQKLDRSIVVYLPRHDVDSRLYLPQFGTAFAPGAALQQAAVDVGNLYFREAGSFDEISDKSFNLILIAHMKWASKDRDSTLTVDYKVLNSEGKVLALGVKTNDINTQKLLMSNEFYSVSLVLMKDILGDEELLQKLADPAKDGSSSRAAGFDRNLLVDKDKPAKSGTGFFINDHGQLLTAAHVVHGCPVPVVKINDKSIDGKIVAESLLLDLAVVDTGGTVPAHVVPLRVGTNYDLGESVTNIGFPLNGLLTATPNVTRGNVSSRSALNGSIGQFQFSAPVQPGSSGGPVISDTGELLGVTVGTLSVERLIQRGILPQNVNFALDARYAASFMEKNKVSFESVAANRKSDGRSATDITLPAVVQLLCYE
ncbi:MAG TPA: serine protease [Steroidobacteraceae bacterium]